MARQGVELRHQHVPVRDPFAWREALSPGVSPAASARSSRTGGTPRSNGSTPRSTTPPGTPGGGYASYAGSPAVASHSSRSSRSQGSVRHDSYASPTEMSARSSDFVSVYDQNSARTADIATLYEEEQAYGGFGVEYPLASSLRPSGQHHPRRQRAAAAAFDAFAADGAAAPSAPSGYGEPPPPPPPPPAEVSLDPRHVYSSTRHGRHKEVEAALVAGFEPMYKDQFGNTIFHVACQNGHKRVAKLVIKYGGDMDDQNYKGQTGLHFLFAYGFADIGEYFIEKGADESIMNEAGLSAREGIR